jgi:hypothetical protein
MSKQWPYKDNRKHYADKYGVSEKTITRWNQRGINLDDEQAVRLGIAGQSQAVSLPSSATARSATAQDSGALGLAGVIAKLHGAEQSEHAAYVAAQAQGNTVLAEYHRKAWCALTEQLRKVAQSTPEIEEANRASVPVAEVSRAINAAFARLRKDLDSLPQRLALELVGREEIDIRERLARETADIIGALYACKFLGAGEDGADGK